MNARLHHIVASSMSTAILLGFAGVEAGVAHADVPAPPSSTMLVVPQTDPPGSCTTDEIGQSKVDAEGNTFTCLPEDSPSEAVLLKTVLMTAIPTSVPEPVNR